MKKPPTPSTPSLRQAAEERLAERTREGTEGASGPEHITNLLHELQVHQIELEMQNQELVSARGLLETALTRYADLYDFAPVGYFSLDPLGVIGEVNLAGARLLGVERASLRGRRFAEFVVNADASTLECLLADAALGTSKATVELTLSDDERNATPRTLELTISGGGEGCRAVAIDVTDRKRSEVLLRSSQKMEAIGRLAGGIAHEFNNLLHVILGRADFALSDVDPTSPLHHEIAEIRTAARSAAILTGQLLAFGRKRTLRMQVLDLNQVVRRVAAMLTRLLGESIALCVDLAPDVVAIDGDADHLDELVLCLAVNARDAMPHGGKLTLATAPVELRGQRAEQLGLPEGPYVVVSVSDTGVGMTEEVVSQLFEPFFTTKKDGHDASLGLSAVHGLVKQLGGEIFVRSEPGRGTIFQTFFRHVTSALPVLVPAARGDATLAGTETILIVEDEDAVARVTTLILERVGYRVLTAASGEAALEVAREHDGPIHLVITDLRMPGMSGVALANALREKRPKLPVLLMSGYNDELVERVGSAHEAMPFLGKPFTSLTLRTKVRAVLDALTPQGTTSDEK